MATIKRPLVRIHDTELDEVIDREMNDTEFADWIIQQAVAEDAAKAEAEREARRQVTLAKLEALGLTPEDLAVL